MPKERKLNVFSEEASDSGSESKSYTSTGDTAGSLEEFIVDEGTVTEESGSVLRDLDSILDEVSLVDEEIQRPKKKAEKSDSDQKAKKQVGRPKGSVNNEETTVKKSVGRPRESKLKNKQTVSRDAEGNEKSIGHMSFPLNKYSLTISRGSLDIAYDTLDIIEKFLKKNTQKGGAATEVGARNHNLHIQSAFSIHYPKTEDAQKTLAKHIRSLLPLQGKGYKVQCKPFSVGQTWEAMIGYITKDQGRPSYEIRTHNITPAVGYVLYSSINIKCALKYIYLLLYMCILLYTQELARGRQEHHAMVTSFDENKKVIGLKHLFNETYRFNMRCMFPAVVPVAYCLLYMLQSGEYILSPEFVSTFKKINYNEAVAYWGLLQEPSRITIDAVMLLIFSGGVYDSKSQENNR